MDQKNLIKLQKEYDRAYRAVSLKKDVLPKKEILEDYISFSLWSIDYYKNKDRKNEKPSYGW